MSDEKIISGNSTSPSSEQFIAGEGREQKQTGTPTQPSTTLKERITASTQAGGLKELPDNFDNTTGDWTIINSSNPFESLYLDYRKHIFITPEMVANNYQLLQRFWADKAMKMNTGSNKNSFKNKYGEGTIENSQVKLKRSFDKLKTREGIYQYFQELNNERIKKGEDGLKDSIEHMVMNGSASMNEIKLCLDRGSKYDLSPEEAGVIIKKALDTEQFKPYGTVTGNTLLEKLFSVKSWMTQPLIDNEIRLEKERESLRIQILPGKYATNIESIGTILFDDPGGAKNLIREDLLKSAIAQKDMVLGLEIGTISKKASKDIHAAFLEIIYKLNKTLPYTFAEQVRVKTVEEFCTLCLNFEQSFKLGKEQFKKGYVEIWLKETNTLAYDKFLKIRDSSENLDLAYLAFLYTFSPALPYRFAGTELVKNQEELYTAINKSKESWEAGVTQLFDSSLPVWFKSTGRRGIADRWVAIKNKYVEQKNAGLEEFLHLLNENAAYPKIRVDKPEINIPDIQAGQVVSTDLMFSNETRGYAQARLSLSKKLEGVVLSAEQISFNGAASLNHSRVTLSIASAQLLKGVNYQTSILFESTAGQIMEIPVAFQIIFPKNAFMLEIAKYAGIVAAVFVLSRLLLAAWHPNWLRNNFDYFINAGQAFNYPEDFYLFGLSFAAFLTCLLCGGCLFIKYLARK